ncbi:MAG TPA: hypothetical protein VGQ42_01275 [Candidatus Dormibacteraeota bacterium]|nr:hypothetical protein [Candidatus Dormibacteraeota bacterium]
MAALLSLGAVLPHAVSADNSTSCSEQPVHQWLVTVSVDGQRTWVDTAQPADALWLCVGIDGPLVSWGVLVTVPT